MAISAVNRSMAANPCISILTNWESADESVRQGEIAKFAKDNKKKAPKAIHHGPRTVVVEFKSEQEARDFRTVWKAKKHSFQGKPIYIHPKLDKGIEAMLQPLRAKLRELRSAQADLASARSYRLDMRDLTIRKADLPLFMLTNEGEVTPIPDSKDRDAQGRY